MKTLILCLLLSSASFAQKKSNTGTANGRFQLVQLSDMRRDQFIIDTQTGKIWRQICAVGGGMDCEMAYWGQEDILDINITPAEMIKKIDNFKAYKENLEKEKKEKK